MRNDTKKLDQLTSLRFFAALMIVIHHSRGLFGISNINFSLDQGVSFFFVLSGFILTYVYPKLDTWPEIKNFWRARIARIWPAYVATFLLCFWLIPNGWDTKRALANLFMVQAWIPLSTYYFSYNGVSWSVSTEFFFYLAFPFIIYKWNKTWQIKLIISITILIALIVLSNLFSLPDYGDAGVGLDGLLITQHGLLFINPLSRIFEFIFGMCIALAWRKKTEIKWTSLKASCYELGALILCIMSVYYMNIIAAWITRSIIGTSLRLWIVHSGSMFVFGLLIFIVAQGRGIISIILAHPLLVLLGEISFSSYLIHRILLDYYRVNVSAFSHISNPIAFGIFFTVLFLSSYLMWTCIEMPGRRFITGHRIIHGTAVMKKSWHDHLVLSRKPLLAGLTLCCIISLIYFTMGNTKFISTEESANITPPSFKAYTGINFGSLFTLRGLDIQCKPDGLHVKLAWESKVTQKFNFTNAIHLVDDQGEILGQADYKQPIQRQGVKSGDIWLDTVLIPAAKLNGNIRGIAIGLYDKSVNLLPIDQGTTDWGGRRLIIRIDKCPATN